MEDSTNIPSQEFQDLKTKIDSEIVMLKGHLSLEMNDTPENRSKLETLLDYLKDTNNIIDKLTIKPNEKRRD